MTSRKSLRSEIQQDLTKSIRSSKQKVLTTRLIFASPSKLVKPSTLPRHLKVAKALPLVELVELAEQGEAHGTTKLATSIESTTSTNFTIQNQFDTRSKFTNPRSWQHQLISLNKQRSRKKSVGKGHNTTIKRSNHLIKQVFLAQLQVGNNLEVSNRIQRILDVM